MGVVILSPPFSNKSKTFCGRVVFGKQSISIVGRAMCCLSVIVLMTDPSVVRRLINNRAESQVRNDKISGKTTTKIKRRQDEFSPCIQERTKM